MTALATVRSGCIGLYRAALYALPSVLRDKHGAAMTASFFDELARAHGAASVATVTLAATLDVVRRGGYERLRDSHEASATTIGGLVFFRRLAGSFLLAFITLTAALLINFGSRQWTPDRPMLELLALAVPFLAAMTIPMALFVATVCVSVGLCADRRWGASPLARGDFPRLLRSALALSVGVAAFTLLLTAEIVPRTNARLASVLAGHEVERGDRSMTLGELRAAEREVARTSGPLAADAHDERVRGAMYGIEIHKKFVLSAACIVLTLVGVALGWRFPRGGTGLAVAGSVLVFGLYFVSLTVGESLAEQLVLSPAVAMWAANIVGLMLMALTLLIPRPQQRHGIT